MFVRKTSPLLKTAGNGSMNIPAREAVILANFFKSARGIVDIHTGMNRVMFQNNGYYATLKLVEENFPNYRNVIPDSFSNEIGFSAFLLRWGIQTISAIKESNVEFKIKKNSINLSFSKEDGLQITTSIPADTGETPPDDTFLLKGRFLFDALCAGEYLKMRYTTPFNPIQLLADNTTYIIMPIRGR